MTLPNNDTILAALRATWPAAKTVEVGHWRVQQGLGGGQRVSAAVTEDEDADLLEMEVAQSALEQAPLVMVKAGQARLDARLDAAGYVVKDPTDLLICPVATLSDPPPLVSAFLTEWPALEIMKELWAEAGIGSDRLEVMNRCTLPKTTIFGRAKDKPAGVAYVACASDIAMLHALEVLPEQRRQGAAGHIMRAAATWTQDQGAVWMSVAVTQANSAAIALYSSLGMQHVGQYHYRAKPPQTP